MTIWTFLLVSAHSIHLFLCTSSEEKKADTFNSCKGPYPFSSLIPLVAKCLQTDSNYFRIIYGVTGTDFNCFGIKYGVTDTDLAILIL